VPESARQEQPEPAPATLGDVLYPDASRSLVSEDDWVRLIRSTAAGDEQALHALYERAHRLVFTLTMRITGSRETAEELTLDVFHDVWRRAAGYDPENGTVLGWIMNQARSRALDRLRFQQRRKRVDPYPGPTDAAEEACDSVDALEAKQQRDRLHRALEELNPGEQQAVKAAFFAELTHAEAAVQLKQPLGTVKTRIRSALQKLRRALAPEGNQG
jgi:RNA polymerase sigma-70 factor (ECF subfamily)